MTLVTHGPAENIFLAVRPRRFMEGVAGTYLWSSEAHNRNTETVEAEAKDFQSAYEADVQFIFSHVQHHWHAVDKSGERVPLKYCKPKGVKKTAFCKRGFPVNVPRLANGAVDPRKYRVRVICKGVARETNLKIRGRRNMLGAVLGRRQCEWFSATSALLAHVFRSNTNIQTNYRLPINAVTHDRDCKRSSCLSDTSDKKIMRVGQRAMKALTGYFGGDISKRQKMGRFELKKSILTLSLLQDKLEERNLQSGSAQLAHVTNRMFTTLESKGILRAATEEFLLACRYHPNDELAAEFIRTFRTAFFNGASFLARYDELARGTKQCSISIKLPKARETASVVDEVSLYGYRPCDNGVALLSPWEFVQRWKPQALRPPSRTYKYSVWLCQPKEGEKPLPGTHYTLNVKFIAQDKDHLLLYPQRRGLPAAAQKAYDLFRQSWILVRRDRPVVPCPERTPIPARGWSKEHRAKVFSVYLRPWTLIADEACVDIPYILDLDLMQEDWYKQQQLKSTKQDVHGLQRSMRGAWKEYVRERVPSAFATQVRNFIKIAFAEFHGRDDEDEDSMKRSKMEAIKCNLRPEDLCVALQTTCPADMLDDTATQKCSSAKVQKATQSVDALLHLQGESIARAAEQKDSAKRKPAISRSRKLDPAMFQKPEVASPDQDLPDTDMSVENTNWEENYKVWRHALENHPTKRLYDKQW